ncbi:DUF5995 family protein [Blastococcus tunisiensis]|uniref:Uncharacterized protein n=1 Tax=Blastococcus tunisiensis TaxID=1798228 RepID=A0A1I2HPN0_9ACTN|nr:DUF5995 family protein [Blastococcus sp. DSM 46838]SFF31383.1 hypothetical protein SAMN05216574_111102 [Blastococcus sp. DSM 46838]
MTEAVAAVVARMEALLAPLEAAGDPARCFLGTYLRTTRAVGVALARGRFEDPEWVAAWDVDFAGLYLDALEISRHSPDAVAAPWRRAFGADPGLRPEAHVLLGMNAHINYDLPQSLLAVIPPDDFASPSLLDRRRRDHERIDDVLAARIGEEDVALQGAGGRRTPLDRLLAPVNRRASRTFLRESRRKVWANTSALHAARMQGEAAYAVRLADLEAASAERVADLLRPGPVLVRLALHGFGVTV